MSPVAREARRTVVLAQPCARFATVVTLNVFSAKEISRKQIAMESALKRAREQSWIGGCAYVVSAGLVTIYRRGQMVPSITPLAVSENFQQCLL